MSNTLAIDRDNNYFRPDSTIVRIHQQAATGKGGKDRAAGASEIKATYRVVGIVRPSEGSPAACAVRRTRKALPPHTLPMSLGL